MMGSFSGVAGGNISPCRFVKKTSVSGEPVVLQCGAGEDVYGISQAATHRRSYFGTDDGYAAVSGEHVNVIGPGDDEASLEIAATVTAGQLLKSDADGKGVVASSDKDNVGARAKTGGAAGQLIKVQPVRFDRAV